MKFLACKRAVANRGEAPDAVLTEFVTWAKGAPDEIFAPNDNPADIYARVATRLGPWLGLPHRRAVMLEVMRVHAGYESSWNWSEGVDQANRTSMAHKTGEETGIFQVSFDSEWIGHHALAPFAAARQITTPETFIPAMKADHRLALEYYARLVRVSIEWAGPLVSGKILPYLRRDAVAEFQALLEV